MTRARTTLNLDAELIMRARVALGTATVTETIAVALRHVAADAELVAEARELLGTSSDADTVHAALQDVVDRAAREALLQIDFSALDEATVADLRTPRSTG